MTEKLLRLLPDDEPELLYRKLTLMPEELIERDLIRFRELCARTQILGCHLYLKERPEHNVKLIYNKNGWHLTCCDESHEHFQPIPGERTKVCTCPLFIQDPEYFSKKLAQQLYIRCGLCKREIPLIDVTDELPDINLFCSSA